MSMDLWYELAAREHSELDTNVIETGEFEIEEERAPDDEQGGQPIAVDFF